MERIEFLNITIDNITLAELLPLLTERGGFVVTPNVDHLVKLQTDVGFLKAYRIADYVICDSKILQYTLRLLGKPIKEKISGSDLLPAFYRYNRHNRNIRIFLLGGEEGVAQQARFNINSKVGWDIVVDALSPSFGFEKNEAECQEIVKRINQSGANVLVVGVGAPKQEKWIVKYRSQLPNVKLFLPLGAAIDFEAGYKQRAPRWMSDIGLEWLHRLLSEPGRLWRRYLVESLPFFVHIIRHRFNLYRYNPLREILSLPIGLLLYRVGLITEQELDLVLQIQKDKNYGLRFGEIATDLGLVSPDTVRFFAEELPEIVAKGRNLLIGEYLQMAHLITPSQVDYSLEKQRIYPGKRIGEILVEEGYISQKTLDWFIEFQYLLRSQKGKKISLWDVYEELQYLKPINHN